MKLSLIILDGELTPLITKYSSKKDSYPSIMWYNFSISVTFDAEIQVQAWKKLSVALVSLLKNACYCPISSGLHDWFLEGDWRTRS